MMLQGIMLALPLCGWTISIETCFMKLVKSNFEMENFPLILVIFRVLYGYSVEHRTIGAEREASL